MLLLMFIYKKCFMEVLYKILYKVLLKIMIKLISLNGIIIEYYSLFNGGNLIKLRFFSSLIFYGHIFFFLFVQ